MSESFRRGLRDGLPIQVAVAVLGIAFGILARQAGYPGWIAVLASVIVVSGAAQFAMVGLAASGAAPILVATTGLALRHVPMSARLSQEIRHRRLPVRLAMAWVLVDETFGLTVAAAGRGEDDLVAYKAGADLLLYSGWVGGTVAGVLLGDRIDPSTWGAEVFFALLFVGLAAPLVRRRWDVAVALIAGAAAFAAARVLPEAWQITGAAGAAAAVGAVLPDG
jgi:4-azaleucine resistance transporter AzlC